MTAHETVDMRYSELPEEGGWYIAKPVGDQVHVHKEDGERQLFQTMNTAEDYALSMATTMFNEANIFDITEKSEWYSKVTCDGEVEYLIGHVDVDEFPSPESPDATFEPTLSDGSYDPET